MDAKLIWILFIETVMPMKWTYVSIFLPPFLLLISWLLIRNASGRPDSPNAAPKGAWRRLGRHWHKLGVITIVTTVVTCILMSMIGRRSLKDDQLYSERLEQRIWGRTKSTQMMTLIRRSAESLPTETLGDVAMVSFGELEGDERVTFFQSWTGLRNNIVNRVLTPAAQFDWPPQRIAEYHAENGANVTPAVILSGLAFTEEERQQWQGVNDSRVAELMKELSEPQWAHHVRQYVEIEDPRAVTDLLVDVFAHLEPAKGHTLLDRILSVKYQGPAAAPRRWAWMVGSQKTAGVFRFCLTNLWWLRELPWLIVWGGIVGLWIVLVGRVIIRQGKRVISA